MEVALVGFDGLTHMRSVPYANRNGRLLTWHDGESWRYFINRHNNVYDEVLCRRVNDDKPDGGCEDKKTGPSIHGIDWSSTPVERSKEAEYTKIVGDDPVTVRPTAEKEVAHVRVPLYNMGKLIGIHRVPNTFPGIIQIGLAFYTRQEAGGNWIYVNSGAPYALAITAGE